MIFKTGAIPLTFSRQLSGSPHALDYFNQNIGGLPNKLIMTFIIKTESSDFVCYLAENDISFVGAFTVDRTDLVFSVRTTVTLTFRLKCQHLPRKMG